MEVILELEAKACAALEAQPGLLEVLAHLRDAGVRPRVLLTFEG